VSTYISIFCTLEDPVTRADIAGFVAEEKHFDSPTFEPPPESEEANDANWREMRIRYHPAKRPLIIYRNHGDDTLRKEKEEARAEIQPIKDAESNRNLTEWLDLATQVFSIEVDEVGATEACWNAADSIEMHLGQYLNGFIYVPGEGIYDPQLERIVAL
jgi:hypothetical protein